MIDSVVQAVLISAIPLILASLGGLISERAGILNISLEGLMLSSAFFAIYGAKLTSSLFCGFIFALVISMILSGVFIFFTLYLHGDRFIAGLGINLLSYPLVATFSRLLFETEGTVRPGNIPSLSSPGLLVAGLVIYIFVYLLLEKSSWGLMIDLAGGAERRLIEKGQSPRRVQSLALLLTGALAGMAGAALSLNLGVYVPSMSAGKGWIALVAVYLGGRKTDGLIPAVLVFALFDYLAVSMQSFDGIPANLMLSLPYFMTLIILFLHNYLKKNHPWNRKKKVKE